MPTCVITGIGSGIGRAVAIELSKRAYYGHYALLGRNTEAIEDTIRLMKEEGLKVFLSIRLTFLMLIAFQISLRQYRI